MSLVSLPSVSRRRRVVQLCLLAFCAVALLTTISAFAALNAEYNGEAKLPGCGHDHVTAEQEGMPITYVSLGTIQRTATAKTATNAAATVRSPPPPAGAAPASPANTTGPRYTHRIVEVQAGSTDASGSGSGSTWAPIRVAVFTPDLEDDTRYCTAVGQYRPDYYGNTIQCAATADILTDAKKEVLINYLMPEAVKAHAARLMVQPLASDKTIVVNSMPGVYCGSFTVPDAHKTVGVADADFVVYVAAGPTSTPTSFIAWALSCQFFAGEKRHPAVGVIYFNPRYLPESVDVSEEQLALYGGNPFSAADSLRRTAEHELLHALGFTYTVFNAYGTFATVPSLRGKSNVPVLNGTAVRAAAKAHYGLRDTDLFYGLELEDQGASGTTLSHWKRRSAKDELMSPVSNLARYTALSIAAMEDLGFYKGNYANAEPMGYGYHSGIAMFNEKCVSEGSTTVPTVFCDSTSSAVHACTADRLRVGRCYLTYYSSSLPSYAQYFVNNPTLGGALPYMDYCPVMQPLSNAACDSGSQLIIPGSLITGSSRCFDATNLVLKLTYTSTDALCAQVHCDNTTNTYQVLVKGASSWLSCGAGGEGYTITPATASSDVFVTGGTLACPRYDEVCYANPDAFLALPATSSTTSTTTTTAAPSAAVRVGPCGWALVAMLVSLLACIFSL